jgi:hypothetical protein
MVEGKILDGLNCLTVFGDEIIKKKLIFYCNLFIFNKKYSKILIFIILK